MIKLMVFPFSVFLFFSYQILSNVTINSLSIINATVQDSGDYACVAEISGVSVSSNVARLTVYGGYIQDDCLDVNEHVPHRNTYLIQYSECKKTWRLLPTNLLHHT